MLRKSFNTILKSIHTLRGLAKLNCGLFIHILNKHEYIQENIIKHGMYEPEVSSMIDSFISPGELFFDIGANIGCQSLHAVSRGAMVHAFEPVQRIADALEANISLNSIGNKIRVNRFALSSTNGNTHFHIANRLDDGSHSLVAGVEASSINSIFIPVMKLDDYISREGLTSPSLIKIDVEGAESLVLDGATKCLSSAPYPVWVFETADRLADQINESALKVMMRFWDNGYIIFEITTSSTLIRVTHSHVSGQLKNYIAVHPASSKFKTVETLC